LSSAAAPGAERSAGVICRILATPVSPLLQPSFDGLSAIPHMTAYPTSTCHGLQRHDHLPSWRQLVNPGHWRGRSIQPSSGQTALHRFTRRVSPNIADLSTDKLLSHEAAACGREDRHRTGGAGHIGLGKALCSSGWPRFLSTLRPRSTVGESSTSRTERELSPWTCA
jgi:hypothetical protein